MFWAVWEYTPPDASQSSFSETQLAQSKPKSYFEYALDSNDRILSQMLLDAVLEVVGDSGGKFTPVMQMTQVTAFIQKALLEQRMVDKVETFLRDLPLIKIEEGWDRPPVFARFDGDVASTAWNSRDVVASADSWTYEQIDERKEENAEGRERGYKYVSALPGILDIDFIQPFVLADASPGYVVLASSVFKQCLQVSVSVGLIVSLLLCAQTGGQRELAGSHRGARA